MESSRGTEKRSPWTDRWLLDAFRELNHPAVGHPPAASSAWESLELAGVPSSEILRVACSVTGYPAADFARPPAAELVPYLPKKLAERYRVVPLGRNGASIEVAACDPLASYLERDLAFATGRRISVFVGSPTDIRRAQAHIYGTPANGGMPRIRWIVAKSTEADPTKLFVGGSAVDTLNHAIADAIDQRASDVHIEAKSGEALIRYRVDGVLHDVSRVTRDVTPFLMSRIKIIAGVDIADRLRPQDGRAGIDIDGRTIDLRISCLPLGGRDEKAVIRLLDGSQTTPDLSSLGFTAGEAHRVKRLLGAAEGMVLVTGPTGSGKTTSLYSVLKAKQSTETNIVSIEDPIEYRLEGINQVQVNERAGLTFASALRSILRQDPDVVLVGEIRDRETADIAIKASLTGHLVLSTLHTNDAPAAIERLADMAVELPSLASALKGVIAQRLVRRLCPECSIPVALSDLPQQQQALLIGRKVDALRKPVGCAVCRGTGYRGRMVVAEVLVVNDEMQRAITARAGSAVIGDLARAGGMHTLWESGLERVLSGVTSLHELVDNVSPPAAAEAETTQADVDAVLARLLGDLSPSKPAVQAASERSGPSSRACTAASSALRVLVAHEDQVWRKTVGAALAAARCAVIEAGDEPSALTLARALSPAVIVMDIALTGMGVTALLDSLGQAGSTTRVVVYTEQADAQLHQWLRSIGVADVVVAPGDLSELASRAAGAVAQSVAA